MSLTLYGTDGEEAATDSVSGEGGLLHVCPQAEPGLTQRPFYLVLRALEGSGAIMVAHFQSEPGAGEGFDGLFEDVLAPRVPFRDVEEHLAANRTALRARGFAPVAEPRLSTMSEGAVLRVPTIMEPGRCYVAVARSGDGLGDVDMFLFDDSGVEVARDLDADAEPSIEHCPERGEDPSDSQGARHTFELRAFEGAGAVGLMVFAGPADEVAAPVATPGLDPSAPERGSDGEDPSLTLDVLAGPLRARGFSSPQFVSRAAVIVPGEVRTHEVVVGPGCALIAGTASHDAMDLDLYLADGAGREIDRDTGLQSTARVRACRPAPAVLTVAVKTYGRDGNYALAVLRAPTAVDTLVELRMEEATAPFRERGYETLLSATSGAIATGASVRRALPLEAGECVAVAVAGGDGVLDVDLFLRDARGDLLVSASGPAPHAAAPRCATEAETLSIEARLVRGRGPLSLAILNQHARDPEGAEPDAPEETNE